MVIHPLPAQIEAMSETIAGFPPDAQQQVLDFVASLQAELQARAEDLQDHLTIEQARLEDDGTRIPIEDVMREFGI